MRAAHDGGTVLGEPAQGWQRGTDPEVIRNGPLSAFACERHIEISSDEHPLPPDVAEVLEQGQALEGLGAPCHCWPTRVTRSTRRFE